MVTAGDIISGSFRLVRERFRAVAVWALLYLVLNLFVIQAMRPSMLALMAAQATQGARTVPDPAAMFGALAGFFGISLFGGLCFLILYAAALRSALRPADNRFAYLRLGMDEVRMLGVGAIAAIGFFLLYIALVLLMVLVGAAVGVMAHGAAVPVILLLTLVVMAVFVFFQVRFSLIFALTMQRGKVIVGESWALTRGRFWTLFGAYLVLLLIVFAGGMILLTLSSGSYLAEVGRSVGNPAAIQAAQQAQMARQFGPLTVLSVLYAIPGAIFGAIFITLIAGAASTVVIGARNDFADIASVYE